MREPYQRIEIDQKLCSLYHGVAPCNASGEACYNTYRTCTDRANYDETEVLTLEFTQAKDTVETPQIPSLLSVSTRPTEINGGGSQRDKKALGVRGSMTVTLQDHPHSDYFVDPYRATRTYDPESQGTFWSKWLARNPFYRNTIIRIIDGYIDTGDQTQRTYIIDEITGPDSKGKVSIKSKDILSLADDKKAQAPAVSSGELIAAVTETEATLRLQGTIAADYPAPNFVRIGREVIYYADTSQSTPDEVRLNGCIRGVEGTTASDHGIGDRVQFCFNFEDQAVSDVLYDLLVNYGSVPASSIPLADWQTENATWLSPFNISGLVTEPIGVTKLLHEICEQTLSYLWYDERAQQVRFQAVKPATVTPRRINDIDHIIADSVSLQRKEDERFSQVWLFHGQRNPTQKLDEESNWLRLRVAADGENPYDETQVKKIYGRFLQTEAQAGSIANRLIARYQRTPIYLNISLDAKDGDLWTGDLVDVTVDELVGFNGAPLETRFQVVKAEEVESGHKINYKLINYVYFGRFAYWMADDAPTYAAATETERTTGLFWSDSNGQVNGEEGYNWS